MAVRYMSPMCAVSCLNNGRCSAHDTCTCPDQYINFDCGRALCPDVECDAELNEVCLHPNTCGCLEDYGRFDGSVYNGFEYFDVQCLEVRPLFD